MAYSARRVTARPKDLRAVREPPLSALPWGSLSLSLYLPHYEGEHPRSCAMLDALYRSEHCRELVDECRQLTAFSVSSKSKSGFLQIADRYSRLGGAEEWRSPN